MIRERRDAREREVTEKILALQTGAVNGRLLAALQLHEPQDASPQLSLGPRIAARRDGRCKPD